MVEVPADGNCMLWSLRCLILGLDDSFNGMDGEQEQLHLRQMLRSGWWDVKGDPYWQNLFSHLATFNPEANPAPAAVTPKKRASKQQTQDQNIDKPLITPPRPERKKLQVADDGQGVPLARKRYPASPALKQPGKRAKRPSCLEVQVPDLEEEYHKAQMSVETAVEDITEDMLEDSGNSLKRRNRGGHKRRWKCRQKSESEITNQKLTSWLAKKRLVYNQWTSLHANATQVIAARACEEGGWKKFKETLAQGRTPKCQVCCEIMKIHNVTASAAEEALKSCDEPEPQDAPQPARQDFVQPAPQDAAAEEVSEYDKSLAYMKSYPFLTVIETPDGKLKFRCTGCPSNAHPNGKLNGTGNGPVKFKDVEWHVGQHFKTSRHQKFIAGVEEMQNQNATATTPEVDCPGLWATDPKAQTPLSHQAEEFRLWIMHMNMQHRQCMHKYYMQENGEWYIRHHACQKQFTPNDEHKC